MACKLTTRRITLSLVAVAATLGLAVAAPAQAQEPGGRFRVLFAQPEVEKGVNGRFARNVSNEARKLIDGMITHRSLEKDDLKRLLGQFRLKEKDLNCITSQQLAVQGGIELVLCMDFRPEGDETAVQATFITKEQVRFEVPPTRGNDAKVIAQHIHTSFETFVNQLRLVQFCHEDLASSQWEAALAKCDEAIALNPQSEAALYGKGHALMMLERYDEALAPLQQLIQLNPIHAEGLQANGFVAAKLGRVDESRKYYNQYLELNPGSSEVRITIALDAMQAGDPEGALAIIEKGLSPESQEPRLVEYAGYFSVSAATKLLEEAQNGGEDVRARANALFEKAIGYLSSIYEQNGAESNAEVYAQLINSYAQLGRTDEALELAAKAIVEKAGEAAVWRAYAGALREAGQVVEAIAALDSVVAYDENAKGVRIQQANWLVGAGDLDAAEDAFRKAVDAGEIESEAAGMMVFAIGANDKFQKGQRAESIPYFELAAKFVTQENSKAIVNFFQGLAHFYEAVEIQKPQTAASAREALPRFQKALEHFKQSGAYGEASPANAKTLQDHTNAAETYIKIQQAILSR